MAVLFNPMDPEFLQDPYPTYARLRDHGPVYRHPGGFWAVSRHRDVVRVLKDAETFSSAAMGGNPGNRSGSRRDIPIGGSLISQDPPIHTQQRSIVNRGFTPRRISDFEPRVRNVVTSLVDAFADEGRCDLTEQLAAPLPVTVIAELLGLDVDRRDDFKRWSGSLIVGTTSLAGGSQRETLQRDLMEFGDYMIQTIERRRKEPGDDLISLLIHAEEEGGVLDAREVVAFAALLLAAGSETTMNLIGNTVIALLEQPDVFERVLADPALLPQTLEESLRFDPPVQLLMRLTTRAVDFEGVEIPAHNMVMVVIGAANRDAEQFPSPDEFDIDRRTQGHLAFGLGNHFCLGASLARLEARLAMEAFLSRLREPRLPEGRIERHGSFLIRGPKALPLSFAA